MTCGEGVQKSIAFPTETLMGTLTGHCDKRRGASMHALVPGELASAKG